MRRRKLREPDCCKCTVETLPFVTVIYNLEKRFPYLLKTHQNLMILSNLDLDDFFIILL